MRTALEARNITVSFGGVIACDNVDLKVERAALLGLTGPNGSGKSTLLNAITGLVPAAGSLTIDGRSVPLERPAAVRAHGVARTFQSPQNFDALTVLENVALGSHDRDARGLTAAVLRRPRMRRRERARWQDAATALERVRLDRHWNAPAGTLPHGQQRMLELARAIAGKPAVLLLDEPSAGLNATETRFLGDLLLALREQGASIVVVDHKIDLLDRLCDHLVVLQLGRVIAEGPPSEVWRREDVIAAYLGVEEVDR